MLLLLLIPPAEQRLQATVAAAVVAVAVVLVLADVIVRGGQQGPVVEPVRCAIVGAGRAGQKGQRIVVGIVASVISMRNTAGIERNTTTTTTTYMAIVIVMVSIVSTVGIVIQRAVMKDALRLWMLLGSVIEFGYCCCCRCCWCCC